MGPLPAGQNPNRGGSEEKPMTLPNLLFAASTPPQPWPNNIDLVITLGYLALIVGLPLLGYVFMFLDFRRYLRSLRKALVLVSQVVPRTPSWVTAERPPCLVALDLPPSCTEEDVLSAYRQLAKALHPDRGGDLEKFLRLQKHFEQALHLVRSQSARSTRPP